MYRFRGFLLVLSLAVCTLPAQASVVVSTSLMLTQLQLTPSAGTLSFISPVAASTFAEALDSLGGFDQHASTVNDGATSSSANTSLAFATGMADSLAMIASATSGVSIPNLDASAEGTGRGRIQGSFQITGPTAPFNLHVAATLSGNQFLQTNSLGIFGSSEIIFNFQILSQPPSGPFVDSLLTIGPNQTLNSPYSNTLTADYTLVAGTYDFIAEVDAESQGLDSTPEPWTASLLLAGLAVIGVRKRLISR